MEVEGNLGMVVVDSFEVVEGNLDKIDVGNLYCYPGWNISAFEFLSLPEKFTPNVPGRNVGL